MSCESGTFVAAACTETQHRVTPCSLHADDARPHAPTAQGTCPRAGRSGRRTAWADSAAATHNTSANMPAGATTNVGGARGTRTPLARVTRAPTAVARDAREPRRRHRGAQARCRTEGSRTRPNGQYLSHSTSRPRPETVRAARWAPRRGGLCHHLVQRKSNFRLRLHRPYAFPKTEIHSTCVPHLWHQRLCGPTENLSEIRQSVTASRS